MALLAQLADGEDYRPCTWDLRADAAGRAYWVEHFCRHVEVLAPLIAEEYADAAAQLPEFRAAYTALFRELDAHPEQYERVDVLLLDELRAGLLARYGFDDPFRGIKRRENHAALELLPSLLAELDASPPGDEQEKLVSGLLAGNLFDLGAWPTVERYRNGDPGFRHTRASLAPRPWRYDNVSAWRRHWETPPRHVLFFVDNAGSDIVLGCLPLARWMLKLGARVTLAANSGPALNDITAAELVRLLERCRTLDAQLAGACGDGRLSVQPTGSTAPLLDLSRLHPGFVAATRDADLIILHGMGRAVESNFDARLHADTLWTAVLKDEAVAAHFNAGLFDCIFRFCPAT